MSDKQPKRPLVGVEAVRAALKHIPASPGVYLMKDARGRVIYVGKAKRLRQRVRSYTRPDQAAAFYRHKVQAMVNKAAAVDFVVTATEKEALILENTLIKRHRPRYNVDLRDDKSYPYFRLDLEHEFPRFNLVRRPKKDGAKYLGPYDNVGAARRTLRLLQRIFPLRRCSDHALRTRRRPCLDYEMGRCPAPCTGLISAEDYRAMVRQLEAFFAGRGAEAARELKRNMLRASREERFEEAAVLRDRLQALERTLERQSVENASGKDMDVLGLHDDGRGYALALLRVRNGRLVHGRVRDLGQAALGPAEAMAQALLMHYDRDRPPPPLLLASHLPADPALVAEVLAESAGRRVEIRQPQRGDKKGLLDLALMNAAQPRADRDQARTLERLGEKLGLKAPPETMECMDISHLGGRLTVASVAAFAHGEPRKQAYRRYKIVGLDQRPDDYAAMAEVVSRRLGGDRPPPDLLVVDGGKGQLNTALAVLEKLPPEKRPALAALAKGRGRGPDRVFLPGRKNPAALRERDPALLLLMRLRDEAHRFAIAYHRLLRGKALTRSVLEEIPGVGPKKRRRLLKAFGSLKALKKVGADEIALRSGLDAATARRVEGFLAALDRPQARK